MGDEQQARTAICSIHRVKVEGRKPRFSETCRHHDEPAALSGVTRASKCDERSLLDGMRCLWLGTRLRPRRLRDRRTLLVSRDDGWSQRGGGVPELIEPGLNSRGRAVAGRRRQQIPLDATMQRRLADVA